ncbi:unnamed protein product [Fraxinus pennsylvanica]|uniref:Uncharacterized protein n=1 Tax=Fraxinus pennsylvanica TaxID=56036 RepID=A0AAD2E6T9_9LAMI|nr:unnamed protein product [Fraxinus pennsylvanica]
MSGEELDANEVLFLSGAAALLEENDKLVLTPFEKNLDIWRQLWRHMQEKLMDTKRHCFSLTRQTFYRILLGNTATPLFPIDFSHKTSSEFNAKAASAALERKTFSFATGMQKSELELVDSENKVYGREELLALLQSEAEQIVSVRNSVSSNVAGLSHCHPNDGNLTGHAPSRSVIVGFVGVSILYEFKVVANRVPRHVIENVYKISLPKPKPYEPQSRPPLAAEFLRTYMLPQVDCRMKLELPAKFWIISMGSFCTLKCLSMKMPPKMLPNLVHWRFTDQIHLMSKTI